MTVAVAHTGAIALRHVRSFRRQPWWIVISLMQPVIYLLLFSQLFQAMGSLPAFGGSYLSFLLPGIVVMSAFYTGGWAGTVTLDDMERGVLDRFLVTPVARSAVITGHLAQGALIVAIQALILVGLGLLIGARFDGGLAGLAVMLVASILLGSAAGALSHGLALLARRQETLIAASQGVVLPLTFLSTTFMVPELMPEWMATVAGFNPLTWAVEASRAALGPAVDWVFVGARLGWLAIFAAAAVALALRAFGSYRRAM